MHYAAAGGQADIMKVLLAEGADANLVDEVQALLPQYLWMPSMLPSVSSNGSQSCILKNPIRMKQYRMDAHLFCMPRHQAIPSVCKCSSSTRE